MDFARAKQSLRDQDHSLPYALIPLYFCETRDDSLYLYNHVSIVYDSIIYSMKVDQIVTEKGQAPQRQFSTFTFTKDNEYFIELHKSSLNICNLPNGRLRINSVGEMSINVFRYNYAHRYTSESLLEIRNADQTASYICIADLYSVYAMNLLKTFFFLSQKEE